MKLKKTYPYVHFGALVLMPVYLFIVVAHLFFTPKFQAGPNAGNGSVIRKNTEVIYYLIRNDRSTFNENKTAKIFAKGKSIFSILLLINVSSKRTTSAGNAQFFQFLPDHHHSYLSNRIMRI
jgi:hypothetical protein